MDNLSLEKFNPKKSELVELSKKFSSLEIVGIDDIEGYQKVDEARKELKKQRVGIEKQGKEFRADALRFQKAVIAYEKELIEIIEPLEIELGQKQEVVDLEKQRIKMVALLPNRKERLVTIGVVVKDDIILGMDSEEFDSFFNEKKSEYLNAKELKIQEAEAKIEKEKEIREAEKNARTEAEENSKREIALAKERAELDKKEALRKAEAEKQAIIDENNRKERERLEAEEKKKREEQEKIRLEKEAKAKLEKQIKYQKFLKDNNYNEDEDYLLNKENKVILMRKVAEFIK